MSLINKRTRLAGYLSILVILILSFELISYSAITITQNRYKSLYFDSSSITKLIDGDNPSFSEQLGWLPPPHELDKHGARIDSNNFENSCIDMFGNSFTWSEGKVSAEQAWPKRLGELLSCRVYNYGVNGYGTDQAIMRQELTKKTSDIVVLNYLSENIIRNVNQLRNLIYPSNALTVKPRFILSKDDELIKIPQPKLAFKDLDNLKDGLKYDYFKPGGSSGILNEASFPYTLKLIEIIRKHYQVKSKFNGEPRYMAFYEKSHESRGLLITMKIIHKFLDNAKKKNQTALVTIIPTCDDLEYMRENQISPYRSLISLLRQKSILFYDFADDFMKHGKYCSLFDDSKGHPSEEGYKMMANWFKNYIFSMPKLSQRL